MTVKFRDHGRNIPGPDGFQHGFHAIGHEARFGFGQWQVEVLEQPFPAQAHRVQVVERRIAAVADELGAVDDLVALFQGQIPVDERAQRIAQGQLVADRQLDVDALDGVAVIAHARQRDDHVLVSYNFV